MILTIKRNRKHSLVFVVLTFYLLFAPPIMGIHSMYFVAAFSWLYVFVNNKFFFCSMNIHKIKKVYLALICMFLWASLLILLNDGTKSVMYHYIYWMLAIFPGAIAVCVHTKKHNETYEYILKLILWAALIQSIFSIGAFVNNDFKLMLIEMLQADDTLVMSAYTYEIYYRLFGFSSGLTFDMPSAMSIVACIAVYLAIYKNAKYLFFVPTIAFSALINARTSLVVLAIGIIVLITMNRKMTGQAFKRLAVIILIAVVAVAIGSSILRKISPLTYGWVEVGIAQLLGFFQGNTDSGYFEYLANSNRWTLPSGFSMLFGTGNRIMGGSKFGVYSDVGYINDIWFGGILYSIVLYAIVASFLWKMFRRYSRLLNNNFLRYLSLIYMICLPILNIKTYIISMGAFSTLFIMVALYSYTVHHSFGNEEALIKWKN